MGPGKVWEVRNGIKMKKRKKRVREGYPVLFK
jgi:hypothetical protein